MLFFFIQANAMNDLDSERVFMCSLLFMCSLSLSFGGKTLVTSSPRQRRLDGAGVSRTCFEQRIYKRINLRARVC